MIIDIIQTVLSGGDVVPLILMLLLMVPLLLISLSVHEAAHGWMAHKCGDDTAYISGRVSLNPLAHLDPIGFLMLITVGFGWAKPVPVNYRYLRNPKRDIALVSLAGPVSNIILCFLCTGVYVAAERFLGGTGVGMVLHLAFMISATLNAGLAVFNLIPLPPLDGSKVLSCLLPQVEMKYVIAGYSILEVLASDYVKMAKSKGVSEFSLVMKHAFKNALIPILTILGQTFMALLAGAAVVESVFNIPGIGRLTVNSVAKRDYEVIQAVVLMVSLINVVMCLAVDLLYGLVDPRVRLEE